MLRTYLKARVVGLTITESEPGAAPGLALDSEVLAAAQIMPGERVRVSVHGGPACECHASPARRGSGTVRLTGFAGAPAGASLTVATECLLVDREALTHEPREVRVGPGNRLVDE